MATLSEQGAPNYPRQSAIWPLTHFLSLPLPTASFITIRQIDTIEYLELRSRELPNLYILFYY
jgi:hypothetical protein